MKVRATMLALLAMAVVGAPAAAQDYATETIEAFWAPEGSDPSVELLLTDDPALVGLADTEFCSFMAATLGVTPSAEQIATCAGAVAAADGRAVLPESMLRLVAPPTPDAEPEPIAVTGRGKKSSAPFELVRGPYEVTFKKNKPCKGEATTAALSRVDGGTGAGDFSQGGFAYGVEDGQYYWNVDAAGGKCKWSISLRPAVTG